MAKGKFEAGRGGARPAARTDPYAVKNKPTQQAARAGGKLWPILAAVGGVAVLAVGIMILSKTAKNHIPETTVPPTIELKGMPREQLERHFRALDTQLQEDLVLTLNPEEREDGQTEEPIVLKLGQKDTEVCLDLIKLAADLDAGVGQEQGDSYLLDPRDYLEYNEEAVRTLLNHAVEEYGAEYEPSSAKLERPGDEDAVEGEKPDKVLVLRTGVVGRELDAERMYETVLNAYETALIAEDPKAAMQPSLSYPLELPEALDPEALFQQYCKEPVEPTLNPNTGEVAEGADGYGFVLEELAAALEEAEPGTELRIPMNVRQPQMDAETLRESLFKDVLAEAHTPHSGVYNRTNNLKLACAAIDGTIVMPGETFSFNKVVGVRTEEKGYKEAIAYVNGGESKPEVGGGICQVASTIYYAVLQADLKTLEREPHMFLVDYVPYGMDATIYWGYLDYKFENNSPYPLKVEASVHDGKVHIILLGTEWKDYTVELSYKVLDTEPWKEVEREVPNDGTYYNGEVISTPYTGYKVATYRTTKDRETGKEIETTQIAISRYSKRDKVIAKIAGDPVKPTQPTNPTTKPTESSSKPTESSSKPTESSSEPTQPEPTQPEPTQPEPTQPEPTQPEPTQPEPTQPEPTQPEPTQPEPTQPEPTEPPGGEGG